jgi:DNA-binding transcriptional LysR family regulator
MRWGTPLFVRHARGVELTNDGKLMLEDARVILNQVEQATIGMRRRARGEIGRLNIGSSGGTYFHPLVPKIIREYRMHYPNVVLLPQASNTPRLMAQLRAGKIDIAFIRTPIRESEGLALELLVDEPTVMVLPTGHPLSRSTSVSLRAFAKETIILQHPRELNPENYDSIISAFKSAGFSPKLIQEAPQIVSVIPMVAAGLGVSIVPRSMSRILTDGVVYLPIDGNAPRASLEIAYRQYDRSPAVQNFVAVARRQSGR